MTSPDSVWPRKVQDLIIGELGEQQRPPAIVLARQHHEVYRQQVPALDLVLQEHRLATDVEAGVVTHSGMVGLVEDDAALLRVVDAQLLDNLAHDRACGLPVERIHESVCSHIDVSNTRLTVYSCVEEIVTPIYHLSHPLEMNCGYSLWYLCKQGFKLGATALYKEPTFLGRSWLLARISTLLARNC